MSIYKNIKKFNRFVKNGYINKEFISKQNILNNLNIKINLSNQVLLKQNIEILLIRFLNFLSLMFFKNKKITKVHYWIPKINKNNYKDERSKYFLSVNKIDKQINLVRSLSLLQSIYLFFQIPNVIFIRGFNKMNSINEYNNLKTYKNFFSFYEKNEIIFSNNLSFFFLKNNIKELIAIDDYRIIQALLRSCKIAKVKSTAYQHGRFNKFYIGLKGLCFDRYIVWSKYHKKKLIQNNYNYKNKNIKIFNFRFKRIKHRYNKKNILYCF